MAVPKVFYLSLLLENVCGFLLTIFLFALINLVFFLGKTFDLFDMSVPLLIYVIVGLFILADLVVDTFKYVVLHERKSIILDDSSISFEYSSRLSNQQENILFRNIVNCRIRLKDMPCYEAIEIKTVSERYLIEKVRLGKTAYEEVKSMLQSYCNEK